MRVAKMLVADLLVGDRISLRSSEPFGRLFRIRDAAPNKATLYIQYGGDEVVITKSVASYVRVEVA